MTTEQAELRGTVQKVAEGQSAQGNPYLELNILQDGQQRPLSWRWFEPPQDHGIKAGQRYAFKTQEKPRADGKGTWRNITGVVRRLEAEPAVTPPQTGADRPPRDDAVGESIERQVALKAATEWACARIANGEKVETYHIGQMADWFARWIRKEIAVKPIHAPKQPDLDDPEAIFATTHGEAEGAQPRAQAAQGRGASPRPAPQATAPAQATQAASSEHLGAAVYPRWTAAVETLGIAEGAADTRIRETMAAWPGWDKATPPQRRQATTLLEAEARAKGAG